MKRAIEIRLHAPPRDVALEDLPPPVVEEAPPPPAPVAEKPKPEPPPPAPRGPDPILMALQEDRQAIEKVLAGLRQAADGFAARSEQMLGEMQQAAVELALAVAKRFLNEEIQNGRFAIENLVRQAVDRLGTRQAVTVYLNPDDLALLRSRMEEDQSLLREGNTLRLEEDRTLARGDVRAEAGENSVLAEVEAQLGNLRQQLLRSVVRARTEPGSAGP